MWHSSFFKAHTNKWLFWGPPMNSMLPIPKVNSQPYFNLAAAFNSILFVLPFFSSLDILLVCLLHYQFHSPISFKTDDSQIYISNKTQNLIGICLTIIETPTSIILPKSAFPVVVPISVNINFSFQLLSPKALIVSFFKF